MSLAGAISTNGRDGCSCRVSKLPHLPECVTKTIQGETGLLRKSTLTAKNIELEKKVSLGGAVSTNGKSGCSRRVSKLPHSTESVPKEPFKKRQDY